MHKFVEIKASDIESYLNSGYFIVKNISNDWIHLTSNLHYVRKNTIAAVAALDASLEKQESKGLVSIQRPNNAPASAAEPAPTDSAAETSAPAPKKAKKSAKAAEEAPAPDDASQEPMDTATTEVEPVIAEVTSDENTVSLDNADENKDVEVQETA